jgi:hypothetical protein
MRNKLALGVAVTFLWKVANSGYHWRDLLEGRSLCAVDAFQPDWNNMFDRYRRDYRPFQEITGLFLVFAELEPTETAIVEFANKYGMLGSEDNISAPTDFGVVSLHGEPLELWKQEIEALRNAVDLWRAMLKGREELMSTLVKQLGDPDKLPMKVGHLQHFDDQEPARAALGAIQRRASYVMRNHVDVDFLFAGNEPRLQLSLKPFSLLGAIWLQFAVAVEERRNFEKCKNCGRPFEISRMASTGKRSDAKFCSTRCRVGSYHMRIEQARRLAKSGVPLLKIAAEVGSDVATIRRWIRPARNPTKRPTSKRPRPGTTPRARRLPK